MNAFTSKKTIVGASALAVTGLVTAGFAAPAFADHEGSTTESTDRADARRAQLAARPGRGARQRMVRAPRPLRGRRAMGSATATVTPHDAPTCGGRGSRLAWDPR